MSFQYTTAVDKLLSLKKRIKEIPGGTWAGKTYDIIAIAIDTATEHLRLDMTVVAETIPAVKNGALKDFKDIMRDTNRWFPERYNASDRIYTFTTGSTIQFTAFENEDKARQAGKRDWLFINEVNTVSKPIADTLIIRTEGDVWLDYNPTARFWVNDELTGQDDVDTLVLTYRDNEALPDTIHKELMRRREKAKTSSYWANWCDVYLDGKTGMLEGVCISDWKEIERLPQDKDGNLECRLLCYGLDFGYSNDPTSLVAMYKWDNAFIFDELIYKKKMLNSDISDMFKSLEVKDYVYADSAEPKSIDELKMAGHRVLPCSKGKDSIVYGIELINQNEIYVTSQSRNLIKELHSYIWKTDKDGETLNQPIDAFNHAIDAARYAIMEQLKDPHKGEYYIY